MSITNEFIKSIEVRPGSQVTGSETKITVNVPPRQESSVRKPDNFEESFSQDEFDPWEESLRHYGITLRAD